MSNRTQTGDARAHSRFAPSSLKRIIACPASVPLCESLPPQPSVTSRWAAEGTVAHAVAEELLTALATDAALPPVAALKRGKRIMAGHEISVDDEMLDAVRTYIDHIVSLGSDGAIKLMIEKVVRLDTVVGKDARCYGHLDAFVMSVDDATAHIIDFKYGRGIEVDVSDNEQLLTYALGAYHSLLEPEEQALVQNIVLHIVQPRVPGRPAVQTAQYTVMDILLWGETVLRPAIQRIRDEPTENLPFYVGSHCRFCPAMAHCPAQAANALVAAKEAFTPVPEVVNERISSERLGEILAQAETVLMWIDNVKEEAHARLERGEAVPGWKLVAKRGTRQWIGDTQQATTALMDAGLTPDVIFEAKLRSPAQIEKLMSKPQHKILIPLWQSVSSGTTLAPVADPRPAVALGPQSSFRALPDAP